MALNEPPYDVKPCVSPGFVSGVKCLLTAILLTLCGVSAAGAADMTVAVVKGNSVLPYDEVLAGFKDGIKRQNLTADFVMLEEGDDQKPFGVRIARIRPNLILCLDLKSLEKASQIKNIPKLFALIAAANLEPWAGRNDIWGVSLDITPATQFQIMRQAFPERRRVGVLYNPNHNQKIIEEAKRAAAASGFNLQVFPVSTIKEIPFAFEKLDEKADLLWTLYDQTVYGPESAKYILMQALQKRIPVVGFSPHFAKAGALLALYGDYYDMGQQAATQALALRSGEGDTARLDRPRTVRIAVNDKVGGFLGVSLSPAFQKMVHQSF
jgi:ABC-type uncharacterized transport system substrate-binding protein